MLKSIDRNSLNTNWLLAIHMVRLPVELILYQLFLQGKIPIIMTYKGWNVDIWMGISACIIWLFRMLGFCKLPLRYFEIWNAIGIGLLLFIVCLAILSSPLPIQQFGYDQPNIGLLEFPFCFLPTGIVPIVLMSHILLISKAKNK